MMGSWSDAKDARITGSVRKRMSDYPCDTCEKVEDCNGQDMLFCCKLCQWEKEKNGVCNKQDGNHI